MRELTLGVGANVGVIAVLASDHITGATGKTLAIEASKDLGAFASISPTVTERTYGLYKIALTAAHLDTEGELWLHITEATIDTIDMRFMVVSRPGLVVGKVNDAGATASSFITNLASAQSDLYVGQRLVFRTGALAGVGKQVIAYDGATKRITVDPFAAAPANADEFSFANGT